jgi:hypothetical protein
LILTLFFISLFIYMRPTFTFLGIALLTSASAFGQSIDAQKVTFEYLRLPLVALPSATRTYQPEVVLRYEDLVKQQKANRETTVAEAKINAERAKQEYKALSLKDKMLNRALLDERKPGDAIIPAADYTAQIYDPKTLSATYVNLSGFQKAPSDADLRITVSVDGFTQGPINLINPAATGLRLATANGSAPVKYAYEVSYKSPISVKVTAKDGTVLVDELIEATNTYSKSATETFNSEDALAKFWANNQLPFMRLLDENSMKANMKLVSEYLDSKLGKRLMPRNTNITVVSDKKVNYDEYPQAYEKALMGYKMLGDPTRAADSQKQIGEANALWKKALAEANPKDKKARIDEKVMAATLFNDAEANLWMNNFDEADVLLARLKLLDIGRYTAPSKELSDLIQDQRTRYNANKK